jgi:hypothetical protein
MAKQFKRNGVPEVKVNKEVNQNQSPNFRDKKGNLYLVRCFACGGEMGKENWAVVVATGTCAWCGWKEKKINKQAEIEKKTDKNKHILDRRVWTLPD